MAKSTAVIRAGVLIVQAPPDGAHVEIPAESDAWFAWLQNAPKFVFEDVLGRFTARAKPRRGRNYWYAFRRLGGEVRQVYLGKARDITLAKLRYAATRFNEWSRQASHEAAASPAVSQPRRTKSPAIDQSQRDGVSSPSTTLWREPTVRAAPDRPTRHVETRALHRLSQVASYPLTVISAPAGYGKTTRLDQWIATSALSAVRLAVEEGDNDPARFWVRVGGAVEEWIAELPDLRESLRRATQAPVPERASAMRAAVNAALRNAPLPAALVIDDYHKLRADNAAIHVEMAHLIEDVPPHVHLVIASRAVPPLPLAKLRAGRKLLELYAADLRFTLEETTVLLTQHTHLGLSGEQIAMLHERTQGWVMGLQLAVLSLQGQPHIAGWIQEFNGENRYIFDYLMEEVVNALSPEMETFALHASVLDRMNASLCDSVTQSSQSLQMLDNLERANAFLFPLDDRRAWYRFHPLFADALRRYLRMVQPGIVPELYSRASHWFEAAGLVIEAIDYAFAANELERAAQLIETFIRTAVPRDFRVRLLERLNRLPHKLVRERPRLCVAHAGTLLLTGGERALVQQRIRDAEESLRQNTQWLDSAELALLQGEVRIVMMCGHFLHGQTDPHELIEAQQQTLAALPTNHWLRNFTTLLIGMEQLADGDVRASGRTLDELLRESKAHDNPFYVGMSLLYLGLALLHQGLLDNTLASCSRASTDLRDFEDASMQARIYLLRGLVSYVRNDLDLALDSLRKGISLRYDPAPFLFEAYPALAYVHLALGNSDAAQQTLNQSLTEWTALHAKDMAIWPWTGNLVRAHQARLWLLQGAVEDAFGWARTLRRYADTDVTSNHRLPAYVREWEDIVLARVYLTEQRLGDALKLLERLGKTAEAAGRVARALEILVLQAVAHDANGDGPAAMLALRRAVEFAAPQRFVRVFIEGGPSIHRLLILLHAEYSQRGSRRRSRQETAALKFLERLVAAFMPQPEDGGPKRIAQAVAARESEGKLWAPLPALTQRQGEILRLIASGASNKDIAAALVIQQNTVKSHVSSILRTLDVKNRVQAVAQARALGLMD